MPLYQFISMVACFLGAPPFCFANFSLKCAFGLAEVHWVILLAIWGPIKEQLFLSYSLLECPTTFVKINFSLKCTVGPAFAHGVLLSAWAGLAEVWYTTVVNWDKWTNRITFVHIFKDLFPKNDLQKLLKNSSAKFPIKESRCLPALQSFLIFSGQRL